MGLQEHLGLGIDREAAEPSVSVDIGPQHLNPYGLVHGAVPFALMDTAMGAAVMGVVDAGSRCATIELQVRYHKAVATGVLNATATVVSAGRRIVHLQARTTDANGQLIATATGSFAVLAGQPAS